MADPQRPAPARAASISRLRSDQWLSVTAGALVIVALVGLVVSLVALKRLTEARQLVVDRATPARLAAAHLRVAYADEESAVRGFALTADESYLAPYRGGRRAVAASHAELARLVRTGELGALRAELAAVDAAGTRWEREYARPVIERVRRRGTLATGIPTVNHGKALFDELRASLLRIDAALAERRAEGRRDLAGAADTATVAVLIAVILLLGSGLVAVFVLRRVVAHPLSELADDARRVAGGEFAHSVRVQGPRDVAALSGDVEAMRRRIVADLDAVSTARGRLEEQAVELQRSNAELEQFAYVASHDLQEPLRKVASFCGMLERRYKGQLDERADQYIDFAVDGAKRMQVLINDLLAFSRVGRVGAEERVVELEEVVALARDNLTATIDEAGATVEVAEPLPRVKGDPTLLAALFQNLIGNAVKFRGDEPPRVRVGVQRDGEQWRFSVDDNGIGIAPRYADRIFVIFQRLHPKDEYAGTGIGLAMCRKIVEYHGGSIWLEPAGADGGASFRFTLPVIDDEEDDPA